MRKFTLLLLFVSFWAVAQVHIDEPIALNDDGRVEFSDVVVVDSVEASELFTRAKTWFVDAFKDAEQVLEMDDREAGKLIGTGWQTVKVPGGFPNEYKMWYTIKVLVKEGRYKYVITDLEFDFSGMRKQVRFYTHDRLWKNKEAGKYRPAYAKIKDAVWKATQANIASIKKGMETDDFGENEDGGDDW